jgi:hypothetical protein
MDIAMTLPTMITHDRSNTLDWCRAVDEGPWSSLAIPERITYPSHSWIVELSAAAALTERVRLWTTIIVLPAHPAVDVAKPRSTSSARVASPLESASAVESTTIGPSTHRSATAGPVWTNRSRR